MPYTISEVAKKMNISASTLRFYDKEGLLPFVERSSGGIRMFKDSDFGWIKLITCLKDTDMSIKDIKTFVNWFIEGDSTLKKRRDMFYDRKESVEAQIAALQKTLKMINYKCWLYDTAVDAGTLDIQNHMKPEDIPDEIQKLKEQAFA